MNAVLESMLAMFGDAESLENLSTHLEEFEEKFGSKLLSGIRQVNLVNLEELLPKFEGVPTGLEKLMKTTGNLLQGFEHEEREKFLQEALNIWDVSDPLENSGLAKALRGDLFQGLEPEAIDVFLKDVQKSFNLPENLLFDFPINPEELEELLTKARRDGVRFHQIRLMITELHRRAASFGGFATEYSLNTVHRTIPCGSLVKLLHLLSFALYSAAIKKLRHSLLCFVQGSYSTISISTLQKTFNAAPLDIPIFLRPQIQPNAPALA
jgi:hypothetical protein